jgi:hypothetical protein
MPLIMIPNIKITPHARRLIQANINLPRSLPDTLHVMQQPHFAVHGGGHGIRGVCVPEYNALQDGIWVDEFKVVGVEDGFGDDTPLGDGSRNGNVV